MKRSTTLTLAAVFSLFALSALASPARLHRPMSHGTEIKGTIFSVDDAAKSLVVDAAGKNDTIFWTTATKVHGGPLAPAEKVVVRAMQKGGKWIATSIRVEGSKPAAAASKPGK